MSEIKLLPCPFCDREAEIGVSAIWCTNEDCGAEFYHPLLSREELIKKWNTRKPMERIIEKLEHEKQEDNELRKFHRDNGTKSMEGLYVGKVNAFKDAIEIVKEEGGIE